MKNILTNLIFQVLVVSTLMGQSDTEAIKGSQPKCMLISGVKIKEIYFDSMERVSRLLYSNSDSIKKWERKYTYNENAYTEEFEKFDSGSLTITEKDYLDNIQTIKYISKKYSEFTEFKYNNQDLKEFKITKRVSSDPTDTTVFIENYFYTNDTLLSKKVTYTSKNPVDSLENKTLNLASLNNYIGTIKMRIEYLQKEDTLIMKHFLSEKLFGTEKCVKSPNTEYNEFDYHKYKSNKQVYIKHFLPDTLLDITIQYGQKEGIIVPNYKIVNTTTNDMVLSQKIDIESNEILEEDKTIITRDHKDNWIKKEYFKNNEHRYTENRIIEYY